MKKSLLFVFLAGIAFASETMIDTEHSETPHHQKISFNGHINSNKILNKKLKKLKKPLNLDEIMKRADEPLFNPHDIAAIITIAREDMRYYTIDEIRSLSSSLALLNDLFSEDYDQSIKNKKNLDFERDISENSENNPELRPFYQFFDACDTLDAIYEWNQKIRDIIDSMLQLVRESRKNRAQKQNFYTFFLL